MSDRPSIPLRLSRLERDNRRFAVMLALVVAGGVLAFAGCARPASSIRATRISLVDAAGSVRAEIRMDSGGPALHLFDETGRIRASLQHDGEGTALYLRDPDGDIRVGAAQFAHGGGGLALHGPNNRGGAVMYYRDGGSLSFFDTAGTVVLRLPAAPPAR